MEDRKISPGVSYLERLEIDADRFRMIAFVGGGGKTGLIFRLAREITEAGKKVIITTTTHMARDAEHPLAVDGNPRELKMNIEHYGYSIAASIDEKSGKLCGLSPERLTEMKKECDVILVEADGSRRLPLKVPEEWEPVIPVSADAVVGVVGLDSLEKPICSIVHRAERTAAFLGKSIYSIVLPEDIVKIASSQAGLRKDVGKRPYRVYLNKSDLLLSHDAAEEICAELKMRGIKAFYGSLFRE